MKRYIKYLGTCLGIVFAVTLFNQCEDDSLVDNFTVKKPAVTTKNVTNIYASSAICGGNVTSDGNVLVSARGVCWSTSQNPTISNSHTSDGSGMGSYNSTLSGLSSNTTYYVRAYATNNVGTSYGEQKSFYTGSYDNKWLFYDNGTQNSSWGLTNGGNDEWAVMFPSSMLNQYNDISVTQIQAYYCKTGTYTLKIYEGNSNTTPFTTLLSKSITVSSAGWKTTTFTPVSIPSNKCLWVSLSKSYQAGEHPNSAATGINNPNARWKRSASGWYDVCNNNGGVDLTWMIRARISYYNKKSGKMEEVELPQTQNMDNSSINHETRRSM